MVYRGHSLSLPSTSKFDYQEAVGSIGPDTLVRGGLGQLSGGFRSSGGSRAGYHFLYGYGYLVSDLWTSTGWLSSQLLAVCSVADFCFSEISIHHGAD